MDNGKQDYLRFLSGDDEGLVSLVTGYKDGLILFLTGFVGDVHTAEELAEDTFFRLITKKPRFSGKSSFKTWLYSIGRNVAVDHIRKNKSIPMADDAESFTDIHSLEEDFIKDSQARAVRDAMEKLNPEYRKVLWLSYFEGFSNTEICDILRLRDRQVVNLLYNAKKSLRAILTKEGFDYEEC